MEKKVGTQRQEQLVKLHKVYSAKALKCTINYR